MTMDSYQTETCFVCDKLIIDKSVLLSLEKTFYSKTSFPTRLTQLLGDTFMVVVSEDDKICIRCANLINRSDKVEQDLIQIKNIILGFLNVKYDLNREDGLPISSEDLQDPSNKNVCDIIDVVDSPITSGQGIKERYSTMDDLSNAEIQEANLSAKYNPNIKIKSEPVIYSDQYYSSSSKCTSKNIKQVISKDLIQNLSEDELAHKANQVTLDSCSSRTVCIPQILQDNTLLKEVKPEKLSMDFKMTSTKVPLPYQKANHNSTHNQISKEPVAVEIEQSHCGQNTSQIKSLCYKKENVPDTEAQKVTDDDIVQKNAKKRTSSVQLAKPSCRKRMKKEKPGTTIRKLRPILPKVPKINEILPALCTIQNPHMKNSHEIYNNSNILQESIQGKCLAVGKNNKFINYLDSKREINKKQCIFQEAETGQKPKTPLTTDLNLQCKICRLYFMDSKAFETHEKEHLKDGKQKRVLYKCSFCLKLFKSKSGLCKHEVSHTGKYSYCCDFCGQGFTCRAHLEEHRSSHTKEERYVCDVCGKKFSFQSTYWIHRKWHDNPFPYKCGECNKLFKHSSLLAVHRRKHTGERPYKCSYCPLTFTVSNSLKRHLVLHTKEYPYTCETCKKGFTTRFRYTEHLARTHNIFVDKPSTDPKDLKMAVHDNVEKVKSSESSTTFNQIDYVEKSCDIEIIDNSGLSFSSDPNDCQIEVVLGPSSCLMFDNSLSLSDSWLI